MTEQAPPLLPLFRSKNQLALLAHIFLHPDQEYSIAAMESETGVAQATISREVDRLTKTGLLKSRSAGRMRLVTANKDSPYFPELYSLLLKTSGPGILLRDRIEGLDRIEDAYIFGSWARRYEGEIGNAPVDIDLLLIGDPAPSQIETLSRTLEKELSMEVNPVILSLDEWRAGRSGFVRQIKKQPLVPLVSKNV